MARMFKKNAVKAVEKGLGLFSKAIKNLTSSVAICEEAIQDKDVEIQEAEAQKKEISNALARAKKAIAKLEEFVA